MSGTHRQSVALPKPSTDSIHGHDYYDVETGRLPRPALPLDRLRAPRPEDGGVEEERQGLRAEVLEGGEPHRPGLREGRRQAREGAGVPRLQQRDGRDSGGLPLHPEQRRHGSDYQGVLRDHAGPRAQPRQVRGEDRPRGPRHRGLPPEDQAGGLARPHRDDHQPAREGRRHPRDYQEVQGGGREARRRQHLRDAPPLPPARPTGPGSRSTASPSTSGGTTTSSEGRSPSTTRSTSWSSGSSGGGWAR